MFYKYISQQELMFVMQILLAIILGSILGIQRERWGKWAGPRTYALVCAGSALFTLLSVNFFPSSPAIIASAIVSGIGFLGAGTILHKENRVEGLTTAAGLWMSAAIGMTVGLERYILSIITTLIILLLLMINDKSIKGEI
ncbi:MAG: MgtC/SapB family protein [Candidatus Magasanikbacteria bacterium]|jgi:putative Mg2+ transporter-C (MgtC) family protein